MNTQNLTPIQRHFLHVFSKGTPYPEAAIAVGVDPETVAGWASQVGFAKALNRARHDFFRHLCDLAQIEEIRTYLARPKIEIVQNVKTAKSAQFRTTASPAKSKR